VGGAERVLAVIGVYLIRSSDHPIVGADIYLLFDYSRIIVLYISHSN
jgi:hypothetical protein